MKVKRLIVMGGLVLFGLVMISGCPAKAGSKLVRWHGLCIPASKVSQLNPNSPLGRMLSQSNMDVTVGGHITVEFSPEEMMKAIPDWKGHVYDPDTGIRLREGLVVGISPDNPVNSGRLTDALRQIYSLSGRYANAKVSEINNSGLYKVQEANEEHTWDMLLVDPRSKNKPPIEEVGEWYAGVCGSFSGPVGCNIGYSSGGFSFDISMNGPNFVHVRQIDAFLTQKIKEWQAACKTEKKPDRNK
jgi:hypothetical protein